MPASLHTLRIKHSVADRGLIGLATPEGRPPSLHTLALPSNLQASRIATPQGGFLHLRRIHQEEVKSGSPILQLKQVH